MNYSLFITFEGGEGSGKTSLIKYLQEELINRNIDVLSTREPGGIHIAEQIRQLILNPEHVNMDAKTEALLYAAARRQHLVERVMPALAQGNVVLCDRFVDSSLVYQGVGRDLGIDAILEINRFATNNCWPALTFFLDVDPEIGLARIKKNESREVNRLDLEELSFHQQVREGYHQIMERFSNRIIRVDANHPFDQVKTEVKQKLLAYVLSIQEEG